MDKQLLQALDNLSVALNHISESLKKGGSKSSTGKAMESGNFGTQLKEISNGVKKLLADNQKILKNQNTIIALSKKKESDKKGVLEESGDAKKENNIKKGIGTILLIAVAVLAIGMAFKLVGKVDFLSVVGLALAMTLISIAFEKIAKLKISLKDAFYTSIILVMIAGAITVSSWILSLVIPLSFSKAITAILIAGVFTILSYGMKNIITALKGVNIFSLMATMEYLPFIFLALSTAIALSSYVLALVLPLSFGKALTAILIAAVFAVISYGLKNIMKAFKGVSIIDIFTVAEFIPMIFLSLSLAIALSSYVLALVLPIGLGQAITAILIAAVFAVISYGLKNIMKSFEGISVDSIAEAVIAIPFIFIGLSFAIAVSSWLLAMVVPITFSQALTSIAISIVFIVLSFAASLIFKAIGGISTSKLITASIIMPILFTAMSLAIMVSSYLLAQTQEIPLMKLISIIGLAITVAIAAVVLGIAAIILNKLGGISDYIKGGIAIVIISAAIMASSLILSLGTYDENGYPKWEWTLSVGLSLAVFGIAAVLLGTQALNPFFYAGLGVTLLVAVTIVAAAAILALGNYDDGKYPSLEWALGVGGSLAAFGIGAVLLGLQVFNPLFYAGLGMILVVAAAIVATSFVFAEGKFDVGKFPSVEWMLGATGVILTMSLVAVAIAFLSPLIILGSIAIMITALTIMLIDKAFSEGKFKSYPSDDWMLGSTKSIIEMALVSVALAFFLPLIIIGSISIMTTALTILLVDKAFSEGKFKSYPSDEWMLGATKSILKIAMISVALAFLLPLIIVGSISIMAVALTILLVDKAFSESKFKSYPSDYWMSGATNSILKIAMISVGLAFFLPLIILGSISILTSALTILLIDKIFSSGRFKANPSDKWMSGSTRSLLKIAMMSVKLSLLLPLIILGAASLLIAALSIVAVDEIFGMGQFKIYPSKDWTDGVTDTLTKWTGLMDNTSFMAVLGGALADAFGGGLADIAESIVDTDTILRKGEYKIYPSKDWINGISGSLTGMSSLMDKDLKFDDGVTKAADLLVSIASKVKANSGVFSSTINPAFMKSIAANITSYVDLAKYVAGNYPGQKGGLTGAVQGMLFGADSSGDPMDRVVSGMVKLGNAYVKLSQSIQNFGNAINAIDAGKLSAIKSFTSNVILMSLMDPAMFDDMLSKLEDKAGVFVEAINEIDSSKEDAKKPEVKAGKGGKAAPDPTQQKMLQLLTAMDAKLGTIAKNSGTLADYTNELRTGSGAKVKNK